MAGTPKPMALDRPFRTGFRFGLGLIAAWLVCAALLWVGSLVVGGGLIAAALFGSGSNSVEASAPVERSR